jgi:hypothetical protein
MSLKRLYLETREDQETQNPEVRTIRQQWLVPAVLH